MGVWLDGKGGVLHTPTNVRIPETRFAPRGQGTSCASKLYPAVGTSHGRLWYNRYTHGL